MNMKRMRGRNHRPGGGGGGGFRNQQNGIPLNRNHVFDSSGPEMRVRGTAQQLYDKYLQLARDAAASADRVLSEAHYQHAEHYFRVISAINAAQGLPPPGQNGETRYNNGQAGEQTAESGDAPAPAPREPRQDSHEPREPREQREYREPREPRDNNRRFEQRPRQEFQQRERQDFQPRERQEFQPREQRQEFQPRERQDYNHRPKPEIASTPIDISSALEAELRATIREAPQPQALRPQNTEPRAIPILSDAPPSPAPTPAPALTLTEPEAAPAPRKRGRPPRVRPVEAE